MKLLLLFLFLEYVSTDIPGNLTNFDVCKVTHAGLDYTGFVAKTGGNIRCQSWSAENSIHKVHESYTDEKFPEYSKAKAKNYCRNPSRNSEGPWCYTMDPQLIDDSCDIPLCMLTECRLTGPGMEYAGTHKKSFSDLKCLKWNKVRKNVKHNGSLKTVNKFKKNKFPDDTLGAAEKYCRNPDGDIAGPWCFIKYEDYTAKEYCDIPFCDDQDCMVFTRNTQTSSHFTAFPKPAGEMSFGIKLW